ncbi:MAG: hypothetical protein K2J60_13190 [Acetatifactor sp.]|nr:hypothetical protein [Acetatifactor sp.]
MKKTSGAIIRDRLFINFLPICVATALFFVIKRNVNMGKFMSPEEWFGILEMMLSLWGTLLGFMITAASILLAFNDGNIIKMLKDTGHYSTVLMCYISCCIHLLAAVVFACICIFGRFWGELFFALLCSITIDTVLMVVLCLWFLFVIIVKQN